MDTSHPKVCYGMNFHVLFCYLLVTRTVTPPDHIRSKRIRRHVVSEALKVLPIEDKDVKFHQVQKLWLLVSVRVLPSPFII